MDKKNDDKSERGRLVRRTTVIEECLLPERAAREGLSQALSTAADAGMAGNGAAPSATPEPELSSDRSCGCVVRRIVEEFDVAEPEIKDENA